LSSIEERGYAHPEVLVSTEWLAENLGADGLRVVESNEDPLLYASGHIPGAIEIDWARDLNDPLRRDYLGRAAFESLMQRVGVAPETTVVIYGDKNNWWATYAFWVLQLYGHRRARILDGGRVKWLSEGRQLTTDVPDFSSLRPYGAPERDDRSQRAFREDVLTHVRASGSLVDVRSPEEYRGERLHMPDYPNEGALRGGHIPGAANVPWSMAIDPTDGTFLPANRLREIYADEHGLRSDQDIITYCRIGERSSHTWFVLRYLLGFERVRNYDGSWTEWGNSVGVPIER